MKLWRCKTNCKYGIWEFHISNERNDLYILFYDDNTSSRTGVDDLSLLSSIGNIYMYSGWYQSPSPQTHEVILEGFNSLEELKKLIPEEFI